MLILKNFFLFTYHLQKKIKKNLTQRSYISKFNGLYEQKISLHYYYFIFKLIENTFYRENPESQVKRYF